MQRSVFIDKANQWGQDRVPFLFVIDFELEDPLAYRTDEILPSQLLFDVRGVTNAKKNMTRVLSDDFSFSFSPGPYEEYMRKFDDVMRHLTYGDSFLTNLTVRTPLQINFQLEDLFHRCQAKYKLWLKDTFLVFSPETFVQIEDNRIRSFPMKGTIDAHLPNAHQRVLDDPKELAEHITIVDLIRNDLSKVAKHVHVKRFRYLEKIKTERKELLQVSSEIEGQLPDNFHSHLGDLIMELLPAGSICGAPKEKTVEIIGKTEGEKRGYYTGILGYYDGSNLDSGVMIRFIEQRENQYSYRSGGGITAQSQVEQEYKEVLDKIYVPVI